MRLLGLLLAAGALMAQDSSKQREAMARMQGAGKLQPGDPAPDFTLRKLKSDDVVRLSGFRGARPVALVFGSFT